MLCETLAGGELCANLHTELAQNIKSPQHAHSLLMMLEAGDVLYLDEIHELSSAVQITFYRALEDGKLFLGGKGQCFDLPPFCLIGSTTHENLLTKSSRDRFKILIRMVPYSTEEIAVLLQQRTKRLGWGIEDQAIRQMLFAAVVMEGQLLVVHAEQMQDGFRLGCRESVVLICMLNTSECIIQDLRRCYPNPKSARNINIMQQPS